MTDYTVLVDPDNIPRTLNALGTICDLDADDRRALSRILALYPRPVTVQFEDDADLSLADRLLADKFTFDQETDSLLLYARDTETLVDALVEMAMYLWGFATLIGSAEPWVVEFAIGAWKPVRNRIKRQLDLPVHEHPRGVVGLPPAPEEAPPDDRYPFRTLVASYDSVSFRQMVVLAGRDDLAVYFPPETHPKVLAAYVYVRRAIQEVAQGLDLSDYQKFNRRLLQALSRLDTLFQPAKLPPPAWVTGASLPEAEPPLFHDDPPADPGPYPDEPLTRPAPPQAGRYDPFEAFIEELFADDDPPGE